jgi:hypothetical protein
MYWKQPFQWIRSLLFRSRADSELDEELKFHLEMTQRKLAADGSAPVDARRQRLSGWRHRGSQGAMS